MYLECVDGVSVNWMGGMDLKKYNLEVGCLIKLYFNNQTTSTHTNSPTTLIDS